jgi:hypothetical protein
MLSLIHIGDSEQTNMRDSVVYAKRLSVVTTEEMVEQIKAAADRRLMSANSYVRGVLVDALKEDADLSTQRRGRI